MKRVLSVCAVSLFAAGLAAAADTKEGDIAKGKELFDQCAACHNVDTDEKKMGPALKGLYKKPKLQNGKKPSDATVKAIINAGGNGMPAYADLLSEEEKIHILAYLRTL